MEIKDVFLSLVVVAVATLAVFSWLNGMNEAYNVEAGSSFNNTRARVGLVTNISGISTQVGNNTFYESGSAPTSQDEGLIQKAKSTISLIGDLFGIVPDLIRDAGGILGIPETYQNLAAYSFIFVLGLTIIYITFLGVRNLI